MELPLCCSINLGNIAFSCSDAVYCDLSRNLRRLQRMTLQHTTSIDDILECSRAQMVLIADIIKEQLNGIQNKRSCKGSKMPHIQAADITTAHSKLGTVRLLSVPLLRLRWTVNASSMNTVETAD